ncbi:hypothetical protein [Pseudomonas fluorescens]|uniref:Uncharacterized protein n=1 Tax=Pseudomonas fluorescens TaxID=294 RepID=A0A5E7EG82_PSEFL|nr:hypothetical protein [Pseudomonas fluorescens]VVO26081.1 hypothetical protein PS691_04565 [Pseudomonas fluorescens]
MVQRRKQHLSQLSLRLMALRAHVCEFKHDELVIRRTLCGGPAADGGQALDHAFDEIRESINHTQALLEALADATGNAEVVRTSDERREGAASLV